MHPHADFERQGRIGGGKGYRRRALRTRRRIYRVDGRLEDRVDAIPCGLDAMPALDLHALAQNGVVLRQRGLHFPGMLSPDTRRTLNVGEQERDRARREVLHLKPPRQSWPPDSELRTDKKYILHL